MELVHLQIVGDTISHRTVESLPVGKDTVYWDRTLPGFGVRVYATGSKEKWSPIRIGRKAQPLPRKVARNVKRPALGIAHEGNPNVRRDALRLRQVYPRPAVPGCKVGMDFIGGVPNRRGGPLCATSLPSPGRSSQPPGVL